MGHSSYWRIWRQADIDTDVPLSPGLLRRVLRFARPYVPKMIVLGVTIAGSSLLGVVGPLIVKRIIDRAIPAQDLGLLNLLAAALLFTAVLSAGVGMFERVMTARVAEGVIYDLRVSLFDHVQRLPFQFFARTQTGAVVSRLSNDVVGAQRAISETATSVMRISGDLLVTLITMFALQWQLTLLVLAAFPLLAVPVKLVGKKLQKAVRQQMQTNASMGTRMTERFQVGGALLVKLFGNSDAERRGFAEKAAQVRDLGIKTSFYSRLFYVGFGLVAALGTALVYWVGGTMVIQGGIELGTIVAFSLLLSRLYGPLRSLSDVPADIRTALVSFDRVFEVLDFPDAIPERPGAVELANPTGAIEFKDVWFRYPGAEQSIPSLEEAGMHPESLERAWVLKEISFAVEPGKTAALVGPSGAGKTTISMLVARLYDATEGSVMIDGVDVRDLTLKSLRASVGMVTQDPHLFHDTIGANLRYAKPGASADEIDSVLSAAQIKELIDSLPDGLDTVVGERGYRLSGGEKQRLAIARLLLKDPAIMILDEATAHLDSESELLIQRALAEAMSGRTTLVIAHRLSTIVNADKILVVEAGRIAQSGTHAELLAAGGLYDDLYRTQFRHQDDSALTQTPGEF